MLNRRTSTPILAMLTAVSVSALSACGTDGSSETDSNSKPTGNVTMAVPAHVGGGSDLLARTFADNYPKMSSGASMTVENYDTAVGIQKAVQQPGKFELIGPGNYSNMVLFPLQGDAPNSWRDLTMLAAVSETASFLVTDGDKKVTTIDEFVAQAKDSKSQSTVAVVGSAGLGSLLAKQLEDAFGIDVRPVVFEGGGQAVRAIIAGDVDAGIMQPGEFLQSLETGKVTPLLNMSDRKFTGDLKDVPRPTEAGANVDFLTSFRLFYAPPEITEKQEKYWRSTIKDWTQTKSYDKYIEKSRQLPMFKAGNDLTKFMKKRQKLAEGLVD